jgi:hypothetical protein
MLVQNVIIGKKTRQVARCLLFLNTLPHQNQEQTLPMFQEVSGGNPRLDPLN